MWLEFFRFDLRYQLRQPLLWISGLVMGLLAFGAIYTDAVQIGGAIGNVHRNAPTVIIQFFGVFSVMSMFIVTLFIAGAVLRDVDFGVADLIFATPMRKHDYLIGRFLAGFLACTSIFVLIALGIVLGSIWPGQDMQRIGAFTLMPYGWGFAVVVLPNLLFIGALLFLLATTTRSLLYVYVGVLAFFCLWIAANVLSRNINNEWVATLIDPFGMRAFQRMTRYYSVADANSTLPALSGFLLGNRALWTSISVAMLGLTFTLFKPQRAGTRSARASKRDVKATQPTVRFDLALPRIRPAFGTAVAWRQCWHIFRFDALGVFRSMPFVVMLLFALINFLLSASLANELYGTKVYPVTHLMLQTLAGTFSFMLVIIITFYAGELIFKERQAKVDDVVDAMPMPTWVPMLAKTVTMLAVVVGFLLAGAVASLVFQAIKGGVPLQPLLYIEGVMLDSIPFALMGLLAVALQILCNQKYLGYLLMILVMLSQMVLGVLHFEHNLYIFAGMAPAPYSDMNGYGHFLPGRLWFAAYWLLFCLGLLIVAHASWVRGVAPVARLRWRHATQHLRGGAGWSLAAVALAWVACGGWIYYNTNVLNHYLPSNVLMDLQANYEKQYRRYLDVAQPRIADIRVNVNLYPQERAADMAGHYRLVNRTAAAIDTLYVQMNPRYPAKLTRLPDYQTVLADQDAGFHILKLKHAIAPGAAVDFDFTVSVRNAGFTNDGDLSVPGALNINHNGTFFNSGDYFPHFGYDTNLELSDRNERRKRGLGEPQRMPKLEDEAARANNYITRDSDWVNFDTTISTSADQTAIAPGYLQQSWEKDGRRYFHYTMDRPMLGFYAFLSAKWQVKQGDWHGIPIEIYYDAKHAYNVNRMIEAVQKSLDYYTTNFTPYQHKQVRILEFPRYASFAQSFANTIPYSEDIGFIADLRDKDAIDYVYYVTAHEMAHQWWAHQVIGAHMQGSTMLSESLAQYSAMMVMEKTYGREHMRRFLKFELDNYLRSRGGEHIEELPLYRVEDQAYIHYRKGALVFYRLRDEIGEAPLNRALKRFLEDKGFQQPPYATSKELLSYIRAEAPADKQAIITDLFEKIVFYDNRVVDAKAKQRKDGKWDVTMKLHLGKFEADGQGKETARPYDEPVEIGIFAAAKDGKEEHEKVLMLGKQHFTDAEPTVTVTVDERPYEVGVDPFNILIDKVPSDNRKQVSISDSVI